MNEEGTAPPTSTAKEVLAGVTNLPVTAATSAGDTVDTILPDDTLEDLVSTAVGNEAARAHVNSQAKGPEEGNKTSEKDKDTSTDLVGKINNLISSDLQNIVELPELPSVLIFAPIKIALSLWLLYNLLGWRSVLCFQPTLFVMLIIL